MLLALVHLALRTVDSHHWGTIRRIRWRATIIVTIIPGTRTGGRHMVPISRHLRRHWLLMYLHVFTQRARMCVTFVTSLNLTIIRLVTGVHMRMLLTVRTICKPSITAFIFAFEWLLACQTNKKYFRTKAKDNHRTQNCRRKKNSPKTVKKFNQKAHKSHRT